MIRRYDLYLPASQKNVRVLVSIPKDYASSGIEFDTLYMLDGQNIFKDNEAAFGRSLRMGRYLAIMAANFDKHICGVAVFNAGSDLGRVNEYTPFQLESYASDEWREQDVSVCDRYTEDFIHTIVPFIQNHFPVKRNPENTYIMGSSLGALYASYLVNACPDTFGAAGIFSNCPFLCENAYYSFLDEHYNPNARNFIYVGMNETSDGEYDERMYFNHACRLHEFNKSHNIPSRLVVDYYGYHGEPVWEKHVLQFLSYLYFEDEAVEITA